MPPKRVSTATRQSKNTKKLAPAGQLKRHAAKILRQLNADFPDANCALVHKTPFQLLVATILSAQCTDERVNLVCKDLFRKYKKPADFASAPLGELETAIKSTGFFRNKAKNIKACSVELVEKFKGQVPQDLDALVGLAGVGRKTANVVLGTAFGIPSGIVVDTHVGRLSQRMGLTKNKDAVKVEQDLMQLIPKDEWIGFSHRMILHGRQVCSARKPDCEHCSLETVCPKIGVST
ncbi:endonuclease III [Bythopirellula polymerisocia]|uniref:Endonuclease III n=1 Tax=Bythopirellula polymerisocia TaxID=2528003 RepID=A0A5C6CRC6_9BACT|nr:endonuclease III [Bythopirellula polymerisocia]TWU25656.1 Ultraviolet N-glycosylase/AP lyase [Bythopirellula polymerisocia]